MAGVNLHISMTPFRNESRVLKETGSLVAQGIVERVYIVALHEEGLPENEQIDATRQVVRIKLRSRSLPKSLPGQLIKYLEFAWRVLRIARSERPVIHNMHSVGLMP